MQHHSWVLIQRDEEVLSGVDDFPPELAKLNCKAFILRLPGLINGNVAGLAPDIEVEVPMGFELVFKRRNQIHAGETEQYQSWKYVIGIKPLTQEKEQCEHDGRSP